MVLGVLCGFNSRDDGMIHKERQALEDALFASNAWYLDVVINPPSSEFRRHLRASIPTIVHFCGHGRKNQNSIAMNNSTDRHKAEYLSKDDLPEALMVAKADKLKLAVINCCFSADNWDRLAEAGPVIGMTGSTLSDFGLKYATQLYATLQGQPRIDARTAHLAPVAFLNETKASPYKPYKRNLTMYYYVSYYTIKVQNVINYRWGSVLAPCLS